MTAFRWTQATGMESISDILTAAGVDTTGWVFTYANDVDDSGDLIVGSATFGGNNVAYLANIATGGVTTPQDLVTGLIPTTVPLQQIVGRLESSIDQSLFAAIQMASSFRQKSEVSFPHLPVLMILSLRQGRLPPLHS